MGRSLGLAAYRAFAKRTSARTFAPSGPRPNGSLVWIHVAQPDNLLAVVDLARRLQAARYRLSILLTLPDPVTCKAARSDSAAQNSILLEALPSEHPEAISAFWKHWSPDMALWTYGNLRPNLLAHVHEKRCPIALIDADEAGFDGRQERWLPDVTRQIMDPFCALLAQSTTVMRRLESLGIPRGRIRVTSPLQAGGEALPCRDIDLRDVSQALGGRPVWLATNVEQDEMEAVLEAHRHATRLSHRLLLVLNPATESLAEGFLKRIQQDGMRISEWSNGNIPDDTTQVLLATGDADLGLFYRVAPVTFMGGSLAPGHSGRNPFEAAALGSAVLYGPNVRQFMPFYSRLAKAGAARIVKDGDTLGVAVTRLIAPDQAATMAVAGWEVVSQGAELADQVLELVNATLDGDAEWTHARS